MGSVTPNTPRPEDVQIRVDPRSDAEVLRDIEKKVDALVEHFLLQEGNAVMAQLRARAKARR